MGNTQVNIIDPKTQKKISFSMDDRLKNNLDKKVIPSLLKKDKDYVVVIDGGEGTGKTTLAVQVGKYVDNTLDLNRITISPEDIAGAYDYIAVDGTLPIDRSQQAMLWTEMFKTAGMFGPIEQNPILQSYNIAEIFAWVAQLLGLKNMDRFRLQPMPDAQVAQQTQRGNLIPIPNPSSGVSMPGNAIQPQGMR